MSYNTRNYRNIGGSTWTITGDINVPTSGTINIETGGQLNIESGGSMDIESGGTVDYESGGYDTRVQVTHTTDLSPLIIGAINLIGNSTLIKVVLPAPVAGARVQVYNIDQSTSVFNIEASSTSLGVDRVIGTSTEVGTFVDNNSIQLSSGGCIHEFMAVNTSQWILLSNLGASACTTTPGTSA